jgi:hypothetical protein
MVEAASGNPKTALYLANTGHDGILQWRFEPLKKRHCREPVPG